MLILLATGACKKFTDIQPQNTLTTQSRFSTVTGVEGAINGVYNKFISFQSTMLKVVGTLSDDVKMGFVYQPQTDIEENNMRPDNTVTFWSSLYTIVYQCNEIINNLDASPITDVAYKARAKAEARFIRGWSLFYLTLLHGDVPIVTSTDYSITAQQKKNTRAEVFTFLQQEWSSIVNDLPSDYSFNAGKRTRVTQYVAYTYLAKLSLYLQDWNKADQYCTAILSHTDLFGLLTNFSAIFNTNNHVESIWELAANGSTTGPSVSASIPLSSPVTVLPSFYPLVIVDKFADGDLRKNEYIRPEMSGGTILYYYYYKYRWTNNTDIVTNEEYKMIRVAEIYLMRAEARAKLGNYTTAIADMENTRHRAGLAPYVFTNAGDLLKEIYDEKARELVCENAQRWFDLVRTGQAGPVLSAINYKLWSARDTILPIPQIELTNDINLNPQNPGY